MGGAMLARLHSLLGLLALGAFLVQHLLYLWPALDGPGAWVAAHPTLQSRIGVAVTVLVLMLAHAVLGVRRMRARADGAARVELGLARLQLVTGIVALLFVAYHVLKMWAHVDVDMGPHAAPYDDYATLWRELGHPLELAIHLVGVTATCFHLGHGLSRAPETWGSVRSGEPARRRLIARLAGGLVGALLWLGYLQVLGHFALGEPLLRMGPPAQTLEVGVPSGT